jgi:hypothetical protein
MHYRDVRFVRTFVASDYMSSLTTGRARPATTPQGNCLRCGSPWIGRSSGRPRKWCSQACRRAAYEERRAAAAGVIAIREVEVAKLTDHDLSTCVKNVADSPTAVKRLVRSLGESGRLGDVATGLRWEPARRELGTLLDKITSMTARHSPRRW